MWRNENEIEEKKNGNEMEVHAERNKERYRSI